jgi:endonuclease/exonuclease/phosphatase family metal-dependent hydrolase
MTHKLRIIIINLCSECGKNKNKNLSKWIDYFTHFKADVIFLQEIAEYNLEHMANSLNMQILNVNYTEYTCVLINPRKLSVIDNFHVKIVRGRKPIYIGAIHLDDIPSIPHHLNQIVYKSSKHIPLSYSLDKVLSICKERRLPRLKKELKQSDGCERAIIAGDFNEPSHFDLDGINTPVSKTMAKNGFVDTYRYIHPSEPGYTWPAGKYYKNEPQQRVDFIYTRGIKILHSAVFGDDLNWISDHKIVMTDISV